MPPRHGKSELASRRFPAWCLGRHPEWEFIAASYNSDLAADFGREVRNIIASEEYGLVFPGVALAADSQAANRWHTNAQGSYVAAGIGTAVTGRGARIFLIDDPVKDKEDADSTIVQKRAWDWYQSVAITRLTADGAMILIQTRWNVADLGGRILAATGKEWDVLALPAIREDGSALWPERYGLPQLEGIRNTIGTRNWSALYQQSPVPEGGGEFQRSWCRHYQKNDGGDCSRYILVDPAGRKNSTSDYTSMWVVGLGSDGNYYVLDMLRDRLNLTERGDALFRLHRKWKPLEVRYERYGMMGDIEHFTERMERENYRFHIVEVAGTVSKEARIRRLVPLFERGRVYLPMHHHYTDSDHITRDMVHTFIEEELLSFPAGAHDDMLDALSRICEPEMSLIWPTQEDATEDRYSKRRSSGSAWSV